jgi:hypothetical protein
MIRTYFITILCLWAATGSLNAQFGSCNNNVPGASSCAQVCTYCDINGLEDINNVPFQGSAPPVICGGDIVLENPRWYQFIAGSPGITIVITPINCVSGGTLEAALLFDCGLPVACVPGIAVGPGNPVIINAPGLVVGAAYQLVVDGLNGAVCSYKISVLFGSATPPPPAPIDSIIGPGAVCPGATVTYSIPAVANALTYLWTAPAGSSINGGSNVAVLPALNGFQVDVKFGSVGGVVCVTASNPCHPPVTKCKPVSNAPLAITQLPEEVICNEQTPYVWPEQPFTQLNFPGAYTLISTPYKSYLGCDSIVRQKITILPLKTRVLPPAWLCEGECFTINGFEFCESGTYQELLTTAQGCDSLVVFTLIKVPVRAVVQQPDTITCAVPTVTLTSDSSTTGNTVTYNWINAAGQTISTGQTAVATAPGQYSLIVTNFGGGRACRDTATVTVPGALSVPAASAGPPRVLTCIVTQLQLQGSGSTGPQYSYFWTASNGGNIVSGANTLTPTVNAPGTYTLRVTNTQTGCSSTSITSVSRQDTPPSLEVQGGTFTCLIPTVTLQDTTNAVNPTYAWSGPNGFNSNERNPVVNVAGDYTLVVTDSLNGCTGVATATVIADNAPPGAAANGGVLNCFADSVLLNVATPTPNSSFAWTGPDGFNSSLQNPVVETPGAYAVTVTGQNGCTSTAVANVTLNTTPPGADLSVSGNLNCFNSSVNLVATSSANPANLNHVWTLPNGAQDTTGTVAVYVADIPGNYSVVVTNIVNGCTSTDTITVIRYENVGAVINEQQNLSCFGADDGSLSALANGGNGVYSYAWNNGLTTQSINGLSAGVYTVTITDGQSCTAAATATVTQPALLLANAFATPQTGNGAADGAAGANPSGGTAPYTFLWETGDTTASISGLLPGAYTVTVTDANNCSSVETVNVSPFNCLLNAVPNPTQVSCFGANNGIAAVTINGGEAPFSYFWSTGDTTETVANLGPGPISVSITDAANCPFELLFNITQPPLLTANPTANPTTGPNANNGSVNTAPLGGVTPYNYLWNTGDTTAAVGNLPGGWYYITITDANGCAASDSVEVETGNCALLTSFLTIPPGCNGGSDGEITVVVNGGSTPLNFNWSSGGAGNTEKNLPAGTYYVTITDANNCETADSVALTEPPLLALQVDVVVGTTCVNSPEGAITVSAAGGTGILEYIWSNGQTGPQATALVAGNYTVTATDENGCAATATAAIVSNDPVPPVIVAANVTVALGPSGSVTLTPLVLGASITDNCPQVTQTIVPSLFNCNQLGEHVVVITATDAAGNTAVETITVTIADLSPPTMTCSPSITRCAGNTTVTYPLPTATDNCLGAGGSFALVSGLPSGSMFPEGTTTVTYSYTDGQGNVGSCSFDVTILTPLVASIDTIINDIEDQGVGNIRISVSGSLPQYTYNWEKDGQSIPNTTQDINGLQMGTYAVTITDENGCTTVLDSIIVQSVVSTGGPDLSAAIGIFPNPTSGNVQVVFPDQWSASELDIVLFDLVGRRVLAVHSGGAKQLTLDLHTLPDGVYTLLMQIGKQRVVRKIVKSE